MSAKPKPREKPKSEQDNAELANEQPKCLSVADAARLAWSAGLSIIPIKADGTKAPKVAWKRLQCERAPESTILRWFEQGATGLGVITGAVSGNLEMFDFDDHAVYEEFLQRGEASGLKHLLDRIRNSYEEDTPSGGVHWFYKADQIAGNQALASRPRLSAEQRNARDKWKTLIETRGEGGYGIIAPSYGQVHETGRPYVLRTGDLTGS
jgi:putative DNA primase/helicase